MIREHSNLLYFIFVFVLMVGASMGLELGLNHLGFNGITASYLISLLIYVFVFSIGIIAVAYKFNIKLNFEFSPIKTEVIINVLFISGFLFILQIALDVTFVNELLVGKLNFLKLSNPFVLGLVGIFNFLLKVIIAPVAEEILYRRLLFTKLLEQYGFLFSMLVTSFLFALFHFNVEGFFAYFVIGLVFSYVFYLTKLLWLNIILHGFYNLLAIFTSMELYKSTDSMFVIGILMYAFFTYGLFICLKRLRFLLLKIKE